CIALGSTNNGPHTREKSERGGLAAAATTSVSAPAVLNVMAQNDTLESTIAKAEIAARMAEHSVIPGASDNRHLKTTADTICPMETLRRNNQVRGPAGRLSHRPPMGL